MIIQFNKDKRIEGRVGMQEYVTEELEKGLARYADRITRIEVHIEDENGQKAGVNDKRCFIEARPANLKPVVATAHANTIKEAFLEASAKIKKLLHHTFDK